jgi:pullulanase/glycogen debranching enzyme
MLRMGDECGHSHQGNNNTYCHDGPRTWFDWTLPRKNAELFRFCQMLIRFRKIHPALRNSRHPGERDETGAALEVAWHGTRASCPDWSPSSRVLALTLFHRVEGRPDDVVHLALNMHWEAHGFGYRPHRRGSAGTCSSTRPCTTPRTSGNRERNRFWRIRAAYSWERGRLSLSLPSPSSS